LISAKKFFVICIEEGEKNNTTDITEILLKPSKSLLLIGKNIYLLETKRLQIIILFS
jgi:hypothetical protein